MNAPLFTYLHDHLTGADFAIELLQRMSDNHPDAQLREFAQDLLKEVEDDRAILQQVADDAGASSSVFKEVSSWLSEKVSRLKLGSGSADRFKTFEALEFLALGIHGKLCLWRALQVAANFDSRLADANWQMLIDRAELQHADVEKQRLAMAMALARP